MSSLHDESTDEFSRQTFDYIEISNNVIDIVSEILDEIIKDTHTETEVEENSSSLIAYFQSKKAPHISINKYLRRFMKYSKPEPSTIIIALIYIDKICENSNVQLTMENIHRLILTCVVVSIKYNEDDYYSNEYYAKVGGITLKELNQLEHNMLELLGFDVFVDDDVYESYENQIKEYGR